MDIDLLSRIVKELITDHDKVGLPGLGTFVAEVVPASFSDKGYTINPPYRRLSFHPDNTEADLLVKFYSDSNHVPLEASRVYITEFLSELKQVLIQRKTVIFPGLGRLRATKENNFFFVPDEDLDIYPDGFGLQPVSMKYIQGVADPVDIKLSYSDAMRGFEDRHRAAEMELSSEPEQSAEPDHTEPVQPSEDPSERQCDAAPAELPGGERDAASAEQLQGEESDAAPAELPGEESGVVRRRSRWWIAPVVVLSLAVVALGVFVILAHAAPDFIDSILYTPEELKILNY